MLYKNSLALVKGLSAVWIQLHYKQFVSQLIKLTCSDGKVDILVLATPSNVMALQRMVRALYEMVESECSRQGKDGIDVTILVDGLDIEQNREQRWEVIVAGVWEADLPKTFRAIYPEYSDIHSLPVVIIGSNVGKFSTHNDEVDVSDDPSPSRSIMEEEIRQEEAEAGDSADGKRLMNTKGWEHGVVAVGGTFDHLHAGHKLLLTIAGYLAKNTLIVGITGPELLVNKKFAEAMQTFEFRENRVRSFLSEVFPSLHIDTVMINDVYGPTASEEDIDALVLSKETRAGGDSINKLRREKGWHELIVYEVDLIGSHDQEHKLSSTDIRERELRKKEQGQVSQKA